SYSPRASQPRSSGKPVIVSVPEATRRHRSSGDSTPPGSLQAMPTIATGSCARSSNSRTRRPLCWSSAVTRLRYSRSRASLPFAFSTLLAPSVTRFPPLPPPPGPAVVSAMSTTASRPAELPVDEGEQVVVAGRREVLLRRTAVRGRRRRGTATGRVQSVGEPAQARRDRRAVLPGGGRGGQIGLDAVESGQDGGGPLAGLRLTAARTVRRRKFGEQVPGQLDRGRVVEDQRRRQPQARVRVEPVA